ncbi:MAG: BMP family protein [Planctomycetes bacterium]|nr:BMP family protein [Planctomycetota bacterium]
MLTRVFILCVALLAMPVGCGRSPASRPAPGGPGTFKVAVGIPGSTADAGWYYSAKGGAVRIGRELKLVEPVSVIENVAASQRKAALRDYARNGYALVICHGYEFNQPVKEIAADFPATTFIVSGYDQPSDDFGSIVYQLGEAAYLCGAVAAQVSQTGCVGFIAAQQVPPVELCYHGFRSGFLKYRSDGRVREPVYINGVNPWEDSAAAKVKTQALLGTSDPCTIDVLFQNADAASRGVFEAVEQHAGGAPVFVFGANRDQNGTTATSKVLASAVIRVDEAFLRVARQVRAGTYKPRVESQTVATGVIDCVLNPSLDAMVGPQTAQKCRGVVEQAREELRSGEEQPYDGGPGR